MSAERLKLTEKQERFCRAYIETGNASEAYRRAYAPKRATPKTIGECASRLLADRKVSARIASLRERAADRAAVTLADHLHRLAELRDAAASIGDYDAAIRAERHRGEAAGLYPDRGKVQVQVGIAAEPRSVTERWIESVLSRAGPAEPGSASAVVSSDSPSGYQRG